VIAICARSPSSTHGGTEGARTPQVEHDTGATLLIVIRAAERRSDFPELRNFPSSFAAVSRNRGIPLRFRFFYALLQGLVRCCRELILKVKLRGKFSIFSALLSPLLRVGYFGASEFR
jgi:hypothetical protein